MANIPLEIDVDIKFHVEDGIAYSALNIIDMWLSENPKRQIETEQFDDGSWVLNLIKE